MKAREGQNIFDVCMQGYGDLERLIDLITDNDDLTINSDFSAGQDVIIDSAKGNIQTKEFIKVNNLLLINRVYDNDIEVSTELAIQWPVFVDPAELVYPYKYLAP